MEDRLKILILYARFGDGHYQAARALEEQFAARGRAHVRLVDLFAESHPVWNAVSRLVYEKSMTWFPRLYGWSYQATNGMQADGRFGQWLHSLGIRRLKAILAAEKPDAVIHTFPFLAMYQLKNESGTPIPGFTVMTDYVVHSRWIHPRTDGYFVATECLKKELTSFGVREDRIHVTGIPLRREFNFEHDNREIYRMYGLDPGKRHVMVMVGAGVLSDLESLLPELSAYRDRISLILVTGRNAKLYREVQERFRDRDFIRVFGYVDHIEKLMSVSACLITKAGGLTLTEALALRVPVIAYRPLPGQERGNAEYWADRGAVRIAHDARSLTAALRRLIEDRPPGNREIVNRKAAQDIAERVFAHVQGKNGVQKEMAALPGKRMLHDFP